MANTQPESANANHVSDNSTSQPHNLPPDVPFTVDDSTALGLTSTAYSSTSTFAYCSNIWSISYGSFLSHSGSFSSGICNSFSSYSSSSSSSCFYY
ncbi:hypothetical protein V6N11_040593 [Hibiscus sabdariffa]|uniref:Uncharacterized protein n=1 Tax=Hibiscus sabdariffa TaxID=183260 RepID=A0ABR2RIB3_9ROSI